MKAYVQVAALMSVLIPYLRPITNACLLYSVFLVELEDEVIGAIEGDRENSKENNRNDAIAAKLLEITEGKENKLFFV